MPTLGLGTASGETLKEISAYIGQAADTLYAEGYQFIQGLREAKDVLFDTPAAETLNYLNLTFDNTGFAVPASPDLNLNEIEAKIDQLAALVAPGAPSLTTPVTAIPVLDSIRPDIVLPSRPDATVGPAPSDAPNIQDVQPPEAPLVTLPNVPTFEELQIPNAPSFSLPTFLSTAPQNLLLPPTNTFGYVDQGYLSDLRDPLVAKLLDGLTNGGYGIEPNDEAALWARARDRAEQEGKIAVEQAGKDAVSTSFPMPQGAYYQRLDKARQSIQDKLSEINREIALKRADLYVENRRFTITEVQKYETQAIALYNAVQERALNFAKMSVDVGIAIYDAGVKNYNAQLDGYKTEASVFESRVRAELAKAELFKAQIEAEKLRGDFNQTKVNLFNAQLQGVQQTVNLYKARLEASNLLAQLQQQKLDVFKSRVTIFAETVRAKQTEFDMYKAGIQGEMAKIDIYKTDIEAYTTRIQAEEAKSRITLQSNQSLLQQYDASVKQYQAQMEGFAKTVDARLEKAKTQITGYNADVAASNILIQALLAGNNTRVLSQRVNHEWNIAALNSKVEKARFELEKTRLSVENMNSINRFGAEYFRTSLGSVLASLNGLSVKTAE